MACRFKIHFGKMNSSFPKITVLKLEAITVIHETKFWSNKEAAHCHRRQGDAHAFVSEGFSWKLKT